MNSDSQRNKMLKTMNNALLVQVALVGRIEVQPKTIPLKPSSFNLCNFKSFFLYSAASI